MYQHIYLSIDPGTNMIGTAINAITDEGDWVILHACTTNVGSLLQHLFDPSEIDDIGARFFRVRAVTKIIKDMATAWEVNSVTSESPYMGRFPTAFAALTECMYGIRSGCYEYNKEMSFVIFDPSTIKVNVGVSGKSGDKSKMTEAVRKLASKFVDIDKLDEHSIDAIAVGYTYYKWVNNAIIRKGKK